MAYDPGAIDSTLASAVGDAPELVAELRQAFRESVHRVLADLEQARDEMARHTALQRLTGLAASFGAVRLLALAKAATSEKAGDPAVLRKLRLAVARL